MQKIEKIDRIVNLGFDCSATLICTHMAEYKGHGPFDWGFASPTTVCKFLSHLFIHGVDATVEKFSESVTTASGKPNNWIPEFDYDYVHKHEFRPDSVKRRVQRFYDALMDRNIFILFTYINDVNNKLLPNYTVPPLLIKVSKLISLFRPQGTFRIAFLHAQTFPCDTTGFEEVGIDRIEVPHVSLATYWIWPCVQRLKLKYNLTEIQSGRFQLM